MTTKLFSTRGRWIAAIAFVSISLPSTIDAAQSHTAHTRVRVTAAPREDEKILHILNRLGFGARPDDVENVKRIGLSAYIDQQLHPEQIDDSAVEQKLAGFRELQFPDQDIESRYKDFITADQASNALRRRLVAMESQKESQMAQSGGAVPASMPAGANQANFQAKRDAIMEMVAADPALQKEFNDTRQQLVDTAEPIARLYQEFDAAKLVRAVESKRQLQEVLVDFWTNHFNIDIRKAPCGVLKVIDDRDVIRTHVFGKFRDLLEASAKSPAMLVYLDNFQSVSDTLPQRRPNRPAPQRPRAGLNENYAREIMELHTLGVSGGYTQQDVHEVARCFTGWSIGTVDGKRTRINRYSEAGEFQFFPQLHDDGEKVVLGHHIPAGGGIQDGETVLDLLAHDPATMKHVSYELCERLVADEPPMSLVRKCVETWQRTDGDLREIVRTIVSSPEFYSPVAMHKKIKSPFEYAVSSVRALDGTIDTGVLASARPAVLAREANSLVRPPQGGGFLDINTNTLLGQIGTMGEPLFQYQAPTGFPEDSRKWVSSGALISRLNFSLALTQGRIKDVKIEDPSEDAGANMDVTATIDRMADRILHGSIAPSTRATLLTEARPGPDGRSSLTPATIAALLLGSPEFQRR
jgi:uncharacterized protein (DUF1800 family)